jgi:hypothetical protein
VIQVLKEQVACPWGDDVGSVPDQHAQLAFCSASSLKWDINTETVEIEALNDTVLHEYYAYTHHRTIMAFGDSST